MKVLLTGGTGFIAAHCLDTLLQRGHHVVFTARSADKAQRLMSNHPGLPKDKLDYVVVKDISQVGAFDDAVKSGPPFQAVLHTASPFHFRPIDYRRDLIDPAIFGTTEILQSIKKHAPTVETVVITSSFSAVVNVENPPKVYDESSWNPVTMDQAGESPNMAYRVGKTFAERAAWDFVEREKPNFQVITMLPTLVLGPTVHYLNTLDSVNTSNERLRDMIQGKMKHGLAPSVYFLWVDVRDVALAHVRAIEVPEAAGKRFFLTAGYIDNAAIADAIKEGFPDLERNLPEKYDSDRPKDIYGYDNSQTRNILGIDFRPLNQCVIDTVGALQRVGS